MLFSIQISDIEIFLMRVVFFLYVKFSKCDSGFKSIYLISGHANFLGKRYMKNNDPAVILIYDVNGYIAGIQAGVCSCFIIVILAVLN